MLRPDAERKRRCRTGNAPAHIRETADKKMHPGITSTVHPDYAFTRTALLQQTQTPGLRPGAIVTVRTIRIRSRIFRRHTQRPRRPKRLRDSGAARTRDPQLRRLLLYPTELRNPFLCGIPDKGSEKNRNPNPCGRIVSCGRPFRRTGQRPPGRMPAASRGGEAAEGRAKKTARPVGFRIILCIFARFQYPKRERIYKLLN